MFPIRDSVPSRRFPFVNTLIIIANAAVFFFELQLHAAGRLEPYLFQHGLVPVRFFLDPVSEFPSILTSMFLHGGWAHLIGNMWFLYIFGDNVEDNMGHFRYAVYYVLMGVCAALGQAWFNQGSDLPMIGASGAIAGILGSYVVLYPGARVLTFFVLVIFVRFVEVPAYFFLGLWFLVQAFNSAGAITMAERGNMGGVAWWAHSAGFVAGFIAINVFRRRR